jgi:lipopolysaccharide transport system ATP-binding protein
MERLFVIRWIFFHCFWCGVGTFPSHGNKDYGKVIIMQKDSAIKVENVSKKYCKSLKRSMFYGIKDIARNSLGLSSHSHILRKDEFWAVDDVSFEVKKGETLGIIGANGAGKTTILKLLNGIFWPDKGKITINGNTGALISVGAGFHPMLTGRENIYLNGAILGMNRNEINEKFDAIVDFADIGDFLDTPVKFYSSGMFVRLGFSVAIHCEPDILLVDEVLSVGDLRFQSKCFKKMQKILNSGVSIVFVSHNMDAVRRICKKSVLLNHGKLVDTGESEKMILKYQKDMLLSANEDTEDFNKIEKKGIQRRGTGEAKITKVDILDKNGKVKSIFKMGEKIVVQIHYFASQHILNPVFLVGIMDSNGIYCVEADSEKDGFNLDFISGEGCVKIVFDNFDLASGKYIIGVSIRRKGSLDYIDFLKHAFSFYIESIHHMKGRFYINRTWQEVK